MGIDVLLVGGTTPIGALLFGEIAGHLGLEIALIAFGVTTAVAAALTVLRRRRQSP